MTEWYFHAPGSGRAGPFSADDLRRRFEDGRIASDTLLWHAGLREWQPLATFASDLGLDLRAAPARTAPPPLPIGDVPVRGPSIPAAQAVPRGKYARVPLRPKKTLSGGAVVAIVAALLAIPALLVGASVVLPGYQDYVSRTTAVPTLVGQASALKRMVGSYYHDTGRCPDQGTRGLDAVIRRATQAPNTAALRFMTLDDGQCGFEFTLRNIGPDADGKTVRFAAFADGGELAWDCTGGSLPETYRPLECRASSYGE